MTDGQAPTGAEVFSFADIEAPVDYVEMPGTGKSFRVRGLSIADITLTARKHAAILDSLYAKFFTDEGLDLGRETITRLLLESGPELIGEAIAIAADQPAMAGKASTLPVPVQMDALTRIARLTFHSDEDVKKTVEMVAASSMALTQIFKSLTERILLPDGSGVDAAMSASLSSTDTPAPPDTPLADSSTKPNLSAVG